MIFLTYASIFSFMKDQNTPHLVLYILNQCYYASLYDILTNVANDEGYKHLAKIKDFDLGNLNASELQHNTLPAENYLTLSTVLHMYLNTSFDRH